MQTTSISPRHRRILTLRHRDHTWQAALDLIFDKGGKPLTYDLLLARDGYGTRAEALERFEALCAEELALMREARPEEGAAVTERWTAWFAAQR